MTALTTVDRKQFKVAVNRHVASIKKAVAKLDDPAEAGKVVVQQMAIEQYAHQIKADNETLNKLLYAKLLCCGRLGQLLPRRPAGRPKTGEKRIPAHVQGFSEHTISAYRKVGDHFDQIDPWYAEVAKGMAEDPENVNRVHVSSFLREVADSEASRPTKVKRYTGNAEWYTPAEYIEAARSVMGGIDLDPASSAKANKTVKAKKFYTAKDDGLTKPWSGRVWMNPPYGRELITSFAEKFIAELDRGKITQAIILTNNSTDTQWWHLLAERCNRICFTLGRIRFAGGKHNNTNGQTFLYYGTRCKTFANAFTQFGLVFPPN